MAISALVLSKRHEILDIAKQYKVTSIRVFGSAARGQIDAGSDIDFLVELEQGATLFDLIALKQDLEDLLGREVDVVTENSLSPYFKDEALKEAVNL